MKTVLFVPGYGEDFTTRNYAAVLKAIEGKGYKTRFVPIKWARTTILDWTEELDAIYHEYDPDETILAGFSFGAMTAFLSAARQNPSALWLFSLSAYFTEDIHSPVMKPSWLSGLGHRRISAFDTLIFDGLASSIKCPTFLFYGEQEIEKWEVVKQRMEHAHKQIRGSKLSIVKHAGHDVTDTHYIEKIITLL